MAIFTSPVIDPRRAGDLRLAGREKRMSRSESNGEPVREQPMKRRTVLTAAAIGAVGLGLPLFPSTALAAAGVSKRRNGMSNINEIVLRYLAVWNERDAQRRRALVAKTWTEDGNYIDRVRDGAGHDRIDQMIATAQEHFPGYRLNLASGIEAHHDYVRFSWVAGGTAEAPLYLKGTDFAVVAGDGRLKSVIGFTDAAPAPVETR
jgi:hypothetical protein